MDQKLRWIVDPGGRRVHVNMATVVVHLPLSAMRGEGKPRCAYKTMERGERIIRGEEGGLTLQMGKRGKKKGIK